VNPNSILLRTTIFDDRRSFSLRAAVFANNVPIARLLLEYGADPESYLRRAAGWRSLIDYFGFGSEMYVLLENAVAEKAGKAYGQYVWIG
jgi:ankyrin repeat protein